MSESPTAPILCKWDAEANVFRPASEAWVKRANRHYVDEQEYMLAEQNERSSNSHRHYFASLNEAWKNLPEDMAARFPTVESLRKYALIRVGYFDCETFVCSSATEALKLARWARGGPSDHTVIAVRDCIVSRYTAKSQSPRAMGKEDFQRSKEAVLKPEVPASKPLEFLSFFASR